MAFKKHCSHFNSELRKTYQVFVTFSYRRRYQWWVKTSPYLSHHTLLLPLSPKQTWLHLAHRTTAKPTKSTPYPHSRSGSTSLCGSMSRGNMSTWTDPGTRQQPLTVSYINSFFLSILVIHIREPLLLSFVIQQVISLLLLTSTFASNLWCTWQGKRRA